MQELSKNSVGTPEGTDESYRNRWKLANESEQVLRIPPS